jgi:hypothetical protein
MIYLRVKYIKNMIITLMLLNFEFLECEYFKT